MLVINILFVHVAMMEMFGVRVGDGMSNDGQWIANTVGAVPSKLQLL